MSNYNLPLLICFRCGHRWTPRTVSKPKVCPKCKSPYWLTPRQRTLGECPHCHELIFDRSTKDFFGRKIPTWRVKDGIYYHKRCWEKIEKGTPKTTNVKYQAATPVGNFEIERKI